MNKFTPYIEQLIASRKAVFACAIFLLLIPIMLFWQVLPRLSVYLANHIPLAMQTRLGDTIFKEVQLYFSSSRKLELSAGEHQKIRARVVNLANLAGLEQVRFEIIPGSPNAMALPGNIIVALEGLIDLYEWNAKEVKYELIDAVIAHELGHLHHRHNLKALFSTELFNNLVLQTSGASGNASKISNALSNLFVHPHHTRTSEREADVFALNLLVKANISPLRFADALCLLENKQKRKYSGDYTLSHPGTKERMIHAIEFAVSNNKINGELYGGTEPNSWTLPYTQVCALQDKK